MSRFKAMRLERGESAEEFGEHLNVSGSTVHRWENPDSDSNPTARTLMQICKRCDISPTWLLFGLGVKHLGDVPLLVRDAENANDREAMVNRLASATESLERLEGAIKRMELKTDINKL